MMEEANGLTLKELMDLVLRNVKIVIVLGLIGLVLGCGAAFTGIASSIISPTYTASMSLAIISENDSGGFSYGHELPGNEDVNASRNIAETAAYICKGDEVAKAAIEKMGLTGVTASQVASNITAKALDKTQIIEVTLVWKDSDEALQILTSVADVVPGILIDTLKLGNVSIVDSPKVTDDGTELKSKLMLIAVGLFAGLFVAVALIVLRDMLHPKVSDPARIREMFGIKLLGAIPDDAEYQKSKRIDVGDDAQGVGYQFHESFAASAHVISHHLRSVKAESESAPSEEHSHARIIYVTSSVEQEGKSTCVAELAVQLAKEEWKTLLIDCDLRNPSLAPLLLDEVEPSCTVNAVLNNGVEPADAVMQLAENLFILPSQLDEKRMTLGYKTAELCKSFVDDYDVILIDTPPMGQVSDAMALNRLADECIFVIRYDYATVQMIQANLEMLSESGIKVLGGIVNMIDTRHAELPRHYAKYSARYSARYAYQPKKEQTKSDSK